MMGAALHFANHDLAEAIRLCKEVDVSDAEARLLHDGGVSAHLVARDGVNLPRPDRIVPATGHLVGNIQLIEKLRCGDRWVRLVDEPRYSPRTCEVDLPTEDVDVLGPFLEACPDVLHCKSAMAYDRYHRVGHVRIVEAHLHGEVYGAVEKGLSLVVDGPREDQCPRPEGHAAALDREALPTTVQLSIVTVLVGVAAQLVGEGSSTLFIPDLEFNRFAGHLVVSVGVVSASTYHLYAQDIASQHAVLQQAVLPRQQLQMISDCIPLRPNLVVHRHATTLRAARSRELPTIPDVIRWKLGLQPCGFIRHFQPSVAADLVVAVPKDPIILRAKMAEPQSQLQTAIARPYDAVGVLPLMPWWLEVYDALHNHQVACPITIAQLLVATPLLGHELQLACIDVAQMRREHISELAYLGAVLHWYPDAVSFAALGLQGALEKGLAHELSCFLADDRVILLFSVVYNRHGNNGGA
mmetsp:Transcript_49175/g.105111  ORF Transcript_49175/g.105111 Transcript_49175/m.105111 type:complete len:468 (+) Transcript_49175:692-2095(+)